jgi:hypothetical protein
VSIPPKEVVARPRNRKGTAISQTFSDYEFGDVDGSARASVQPSYSVRYLYYSRISTPNK